MDARIENAYALLNYITEPGVGIVAFPKMKQLSI